MDENFEWLLAALAVCLLGAWLGYQAFRRAASKREAARARAEAAAWAEAQRRADEKAARHKARSEAAALGAARVAAAEAERIEAAVVAAHEAARFHAQQLASEEADRARRQAGAAHRDALLATQQAADEVRARIAQAEAELQARREAERAVRLAAEATLAKQAALAAQAALATTLAAPPSPAPAPPSPKAPEQTIVMVADDSKIVRVKTGRLLAQHRYQIVYANDGLEAAQQIEASMPDVVITDVDMPGMDGFELTRHVRQNPLTAHIPVIMITAADDKHRADADRAGVSVLLGKPYPEDELIAHIRRAMNPADAKTGALA
ncbi:MAG: response regulator [Bacteriovorax sp.]|nr:response regulator [Rhizobacter sp.]